MTGTGRSGRVASWGTSGTVLAPTGEPRVDPSLRAHTFCHVVPRTWYVMGVMLSAGGAFAWYRDVMAKELKGRKDTNLVLNKEADTAPIGGGTVPGRERDAATVAARGSTCITTCCGGGALRTATT